MKYKHMKKKWINPTWEYLPVEFDFGPEDDFAATGSAS